MLNLVQITILLFLSSLAYSQNLIKNGGFEDYHKLPEKDGCFNDYIKNWSNLNGKKGYPNGTPDFLHKKGNDNGKVSNYYYSKVEPYAGDAMMGVIVMPERPFYEYVSAEVPIKKGKRYEFSMYINNGAPKYCGCSGKGLGVYFSKKLPFQEKAELVEAQAQWMIDEQFYTTTWEKIRFKFTAPENYDHLTIGYFLKPKEIDMKPIKSSSDCIYFFIDEISLEEINENSNEFVQLDLPYAIKKIKTEFQNQNITENIPKKDSVIKIIQNKPIQVNIHIVDKNNTLPLTSELSIVELNSLKEIVKVSDVNMYTFEIPDSNIFYAAYAKSTGYIDGSIKIEPKKLSQLELKNIPLELSKIKKGEKIVLKNIYFETNKADLLPSSFIELTKLITFLTENPSIQVEISGHTDSDGSDEMNLDLSKRRAQSVVDYLKTKIDVKRLKSVGYGEKMPIAPNTPEGKQLNRRVEFKIL